MNDLDKSVLLASGRPDPAGNARCEYLAFSLGREEYAVDILKVREVRGGEVVTALANPDSLIRRVACLGGTLVPVLDMSFRFCPGKLAGNPFAAVIVFDLAGRTVGIAVDGLNDVVWIAKGQEGGEPDFSVSVFDTRRIPGEGGVADRIVTLMDVEKFIAGCEIDFADPLLQGAALKRSS